MVLSVAWDTDQEATVSTAGPDRPTIPMMLIHGAWLASSSWERFAEYFGERGYAVTAPEWPRKSGDADDLREHADELAGMGVREVVDHYDALIRELDEPPVLMGHSFGGLFVQLLLDRGLGRAGVAMSPGPTKGVLRLPFSTIKAASPALAHPSTRHGVVPLDLEEFTYGFVNTFPEDQAAAAFERYAVPETGRIFFEAGFANLRLHGPTEVDYEREGRAPLLIVGAGKDHTVPASVSRANHKKYKHSESVTDYVEFDDRPHLMMVGDGWEGVAATIDDWLGRVVRTAPTTDARA